MTAPAVTVAPEVLQAFNAAGYEVEVSTPAPLVGRGSRTFRKGHLVVAVRVWPKAAGRTFGERRELSALPAELDAVVARDLAYLARSYVRSHRAAAEAARRRADAANAEAAEHEACAARTDAALGPVATQGGWS